MTNRIQEKSFQSWTEIKKFIDELKHRKDFIWRGQSCSEWILSSSLFRYFKSQSIPKNHRRQYEEKAIMTFSEHNSNELKETFHKERNIINIMVTMQHYGCPTRLIDWTKSPYIAAFFCLADMDKIGAIYGLNLTEYQKKISAHLVLDDYYGELLDWLPNRYYQMMLNQKDFIYPIPIAPKPLTQRHYDQQSIFLLDMKLDIAVEEVLSSATPELIWKITFPRKIRNDIYSDLEQMNIDGYHLFKGLDGIALKAKHMLFGAPSFGESIQVK